MESKIESLISKYETKIEELTNNMKNKKVSMSVRKIIYIKIEMLESIIKDLTK